LNNEFVHYSIKFSWKSHFKYFRIMNELISQYGMNYLFNIEDEFLILSYILFQKILWRFQSENWSLFLGGTILWGGFGYRALLQKGPVTLSILLRIHVDTTCKSPRMVPPRMVALLPVAYSAFTVTPPIGHRGWCHQEYGVASISRLL